MSLFGVDLRHLSDPAVGVLAFVACFAVWRCSARFREFARSRDRRVEFPWDGWRPHSAVLGSVERVSGYHDITRYPHARLIPGLVLFRWDAPLFFANAELFHQRTLDAVAKSPTPVRWLVIAAEPVTSVDVTAADVVSELDDTLHAAGVELCFAEMKDPVKDKLKRFGLFARLGEQAFFATIDEAVGAYRATHAVD
jgi:MFS superfamily sulfate permease-like transporter